MPCGLYDGHAYSMLGAHIVVDNEEKSHFLIEIRNPWGNSLEWREDWSDNCSKWDTLKAWFPI